MNHEHIIETDDFTSYTKIYAEMPKNDTVTVSISTFDEKEPEVLTGKAAIVMIDMIHTADGKETEKTAAMISGNLTQRSIAKMLQSMAEAFSQTMDVKMLLFIKMYFLHEMDEQLKVKAKELLGDELHESIANLFKKMREDAGE